MVDGISSAFELNPLREVDFHRAPATSSVAKRVMTLVVKLGDTMKRGVVGKLVQFRRFGATLSQPLERLNIATFGFSFKVLADLL